MKMLHDGTTKILCGWFGTCVYYFCGASLDSRMVDLNSVSNTVESNSIALRCCNYQPTLDVAHSRSKGLGARMGDRRSIVR